MTVNAARDGSDEYEQLWEAQTDDLYLEQNAIVPESERRDYQEEDPDGGYFFPESQAAGSPSQHLDWRPPEPEDFADEGGGYHELPASSPSAVPRQRLASNGGSRSPLDEAYSANQNIALRARPASKRTSFPKLAPEITGKADLFGKQKERKIVAQF